MPVTSNINNNVNIANIDNKNDKKIEEGYKDKANKSLSKHNNKKKKHKCKINEHIYMVYYILL